MGIGRRLVWLVFIPLALGAGCAGRTPPAAAPRVAASWPQAYRDAVADALDPEPSEIATDLVAIVPSNPMLTWRRFPDGERVLVVSLVDDASAYPAASGSPYDTGTEDIWVTAVPEVRDRCRRPEFGGQDFAMRLRQLIGLTPSEPVTAFVELWVLPSQLFRPAADNEITDTTAGLVLPDTVEPWYREWFNRLRATQYVQSADPPHDAYPWTQLGYTYDWGSTDHRGPSEFVIRQHASVIVNGITPYRAYCGR